MMKIAVIGAGAIGGLVAGYLKLKEENVTLVAHPGSVKAIQDKGLNISGVRGDFNVRIEVSAQLNYRPDLAILATKTQDIEGALKENRDFILDSPLLTTQNGIQADHLAAQVSPEENIISSIVMFGSTCLEPAKITHNFEGGWILGRVFKGDKQKVEEISEILNEIFPVTVSQDLLGMKYLKVFVNANNCIPAILGVSMQEAFSDLEISSVSIAIWKEGLDIVKKAGINLISLPDFPVDRLYRLTGMPLLEAAGIFSGIMSNLSKEPIYGSILQSIKRGKPSEIDYINGEFVRLAKDHNSSAPLNKAMVEMVHSVERDKRFFSKEGLLERVKKQGDFS